MKYCSNCAAPHIDKVFPLTCPNCKEIFYKNPLPVGIAIVPISDIFGQVNLLAIRRNINPDKGKLALAGGFINFGETWEEGIVRELREETEIIYEAKDVKLETVRTSINKHLLIFGTLPQLNYDEINWKFNNDEVQEVVMIKDPNELIWQTHKEIASRFLF